MIARIHGTLLSRDADGTVEVATPGGVVYELDVPLTVLARLPLPPAPVELRALQVVREDSITLYGFLEASERELFRRLLAARGVGARLALTMLSTYAAPRLARAIAEKDVAILKQVSGVGKKTAEQIVIDLSDKVEDLAIDVGVRGEAAPATVKEAVAALVALGFPFADADTAVRIAVEENGAGASTEELIRRALAAHP